MITAKEALEIAKLNTTEDVSEHIAYIEKLIKKAIEKGDTKITIQKNPYARLFHEDRSSTTQEIINVLKNNGYTVEEYYNKNDRNIGMMIDWSNA